MMSASILSVMRGSLPRHLSISLLAAALLLGASRDVVGEYACLHHGASEKVGSGPAPASEETHSVHHGHAAGSEQPGAQNHGEHATLCDCTGGCPASGSFPLPNLGVAVAAATSPLLDPTRASPASEVRVARIILRLLPFANGPPVLA